MVPEPQRTHRNHVGQARLRRTPAATPSTTSAALTYSGAGDRQDPPRLACRSPRHGVLRGRPDVWL